MAMFIGCSIKDKNPSMVPLGAHKAHVIRVFIYSMPSFAHGYVGAITQRNHEDDNPVPPSER